MIIGTCGFASTGSSAVSDFLKEFDENQVFDQFEFTLPYLPDGLEDLEYHLTQHVCRDDSCGIAIPRFKRCIEKEFGLVLKKQFNISQQQLNEITRQFLDSIVQLKWKTAKRTDMLLNPSWFYYFFGFRVMKCHVLPYLQKKIGRVVDIWPYRDVEVSIFPDNFYEASRSFIRNILSGMGADFNKNIVLDQPFLGSNPVRSFCFFDNPRAIVVDRDPRDNYLFTKLVLYKTENIMPVDDVKTFVKYYRLFRDNHPYKQPDKDVLCVRFEDMIYNYESTTERIRDFCNLPVNPNPKSIFDPNLSIANTQLFLRFPEYKADIEFIEKELPEYLFNYDDYPKPNISGKMFSGKSPLNK
jgi:hypothetical protein